MFLYIHIPFCNYKCQYCAFRSFAGQNDFIGIYVSQLEKEIKSKLKELSIKQKQTIKGIYFGGGTPNTLNISQYESILNTIWKYIPQSQIIELSTEIAPTNTSLLFFKQLTDLNFTRITIGIETFDERLRASTGRLHTTDEFLATFNYAREAKIPSVGADLIMGLPKQSFEIVKNDIQTLVRLKPDHISSYLLGIEEDSVYYKIQNKLTFPTNTIITKSYKYTQKFLAESGYKQYEISSWAKPNHQSKYNLNIWKFGEYLGFGLSAYSHFDNTRWQNELNLKKYIKQKSFSLLNQKKEERSEYEIEFEKVLLGLRLNKGLDLKIMKNRKLLERIKNESLIMIQDNHAYIKQQNILEYDRILESLY